MNRSGSHRAAQGYAGNPCQAAGAARIERGRQIRGTSLPGAEAVSAGLRATKQGKQGHRARGNRELPGRAEFWDSTVTFRAWEHLLRIHE